MFGMKEKLAPICVAAAAACVLALAGCGSSDGMTGGVAATVNGTDIAEDQVTNYIQDLRSSQNVSSEEDWANWLNSSGYTPESLREAVINMYVTQELEKAAAADAGVEVTDEEVDAVVESMRSNYDSDEAWQNALSSAGLTEESYRENVYQPMLEEKLLDAVLDEKDTKADDDTVLSYLQMYASSLDGMKRSSHILFAADDKKTAQKVLDELNNGADFAELAKEYSTDSGSAQNGGDVGWSGLNSFVDAYSDALDKLKEGETSGLVTSEYGIHIIRCTDIWNAPDEIKKLSDAPDELVATFY
jgi:foldase protein PrsA